MLINHLNNWKQPFRGVFQKGFLKKKKTKILEKYPWRSPFYKVIISLPLHFQNSGTAISKEHLPMSVSA